MFSISRVMTSFAPAVNCGPVGVEHLGEADGPHHLDRLFELAVGEEEEAEVGPGRDGQPPRSTSRRFSSSRARHAVRLLRVGRLQVDVDTSRRGSGRRRGTVRPAVRARP